MGSFFEDYQDRLEELHRDILQGIEGLTTEALDWSPGNDIPTLGVLVTHIVGAERYWIGDVAGGVPSNRDRDSEFKAKGQEAAALIAHLQELESFEKELLSKISTPDLESICISPRTGRRFSVGWALLHALEHTALHLGHIQIIHQLWEQSRPE
jgi:uncharacterized damage-inducible protein DinB